MSRESIEFTTELAVTDFKDISDFQRLPSNLYPSPDHDDLIEVSVYLEAFDDVYVAAGTDDVWHLLTTDARHRLLDHAERLLNDKIQDGIEAALDAQFDYYKEEGLL